MGKRAVHCSHLCDSRDTDLGVDGLSVSCAQTPAWPRELSLCCSDSLERVADVVLGVMSSSSLQEWGQTPCSSALKSCSELRDQQCVFPVAQSSWHVAPQVDWEGL